MVLMREVDSPLKILVQGSTLYYQKHPKVLCSTVSALRPTKAVSRSSPFIVFFSPLLVSLLLLLLLLLLLHYHHHYHR